MPTRHNGSGAHTLWPNGGNVIRQFVMIYTADDATSDRHTAQNGDCAE